MKAFLIVPLLLLAVFSLAHGQRGVSQSDLNAIRLQLAPLYILSYVMSVDSAAGIPGKYESVVSDEYGTLKGCLILTAMGKRQPGGYYPHGFVAIYRQGAIIWRSDTLINSRSVAGGGKVLDIRDLNRDGTIDITTNWLEGRANGAAEYLWIVSWNGMSGRLINKYDAASGESSLISADGSLSIVDVQGDGIIEFRGEWPEGTPVEYRWNGSLYGPENGDPPPGEGMLLRDRLIVDISTHVLQVGNDLQFRYEVSNNISSGQSMDDLLIYPMNANQVVAKGRTKWKAARGRWTNFFFEPNFLRPGEKDSTFLLQSPGPISVTRFYAQGHNGTGYSGDEIFHNSFQGLTIAPAQIPHNISLHDFLDSLYVWASHLPELEWITPASAGDKYLAYVDSARIAATGGNFGSVQDILQRMLVDISIDSSSVLKGEAYALLRYDAEFVLDQIPVGGAFSSYCLFATHSLWLEQNASVFSGDVGVNDAGIAPFLSSEVELTIGIGTSLVPGSSVKANRIKVKQSAVVESEVYYNELENNGTITGTLHTPLTLPLIPNLPEFKSASPGSQDITIPQNGSQIIEPGSYGDILVRKNGRLTFTGGTYHLATLNTGDNVQLVFQAASEVRIDGRFDTDQGTYLGPQDTTTLSASQIVFYIAGINGSNGNLGATPKAAQIGISNTVIANFYVPNGTLWIRQNSQATGAFLGKDVDIGIGVKIWIKSAF